MILDIFGWVALATKGRRKTLRNASFADLPVCRWRRAAAELSNGAKYGAASDNISQKVNFAELTHFVDRISHLVLTRAAGQVRISLLLQSGRRAKLKYSIF